MPEGLERDLAIDRTNEQLLSTSQAIGQIAVEPLADTTQQPSLDELLTEQIVAFETSQQARLDDDPDAAHSAGQKLNDLNERTLRAALDNVAAHTAESDPKE